MRRLFLVVDLSLLRQPGEEAREAVLSELTTAIARLWAAYQQGSGGGSGQARGRTSWGYALYDSACPDLLLKPKLRRIAQTLRLPAAFQETMHTDCRGGELVHLIALIQGATQPDAGQPAARAAVGGPPAAALANAVKNALASSYLRKLQELADNDSGSSAASQAEGLLVLFSTQLGAGFGGAAAAGGAAGSPEAQAQRLLAAALPEALWQRCASGLRVCWAPAGGGAAALPLLPALQAAMQQQCKGAAALCLSELAGPATLPQFAARLSLPAAGEVAQPGGEAEEDEACWPAAAGPEESALDNLKLLLAQLEGHQEREAEEARRRLRSEHRQLAKQRQQGMLPGVPRRKSAPALVANKGRALLENAQRLAAGKGRKSVPSQPNSTRGTPTGEDGAFSDDQQQVLAALAAAAADGEEEEVTSSVRGMPPEAAAADLKGRIDALVASTIAADAPPAPPDLLKQVRQMVEGTFTSALRFTGGGRASQGAPPAGDAAAAAAAAPPQQPGASGAAAAAAAAAAALPYPLDGLRALLLQRVPTAVADLRRQHGEAAEPEDIRRLSHRLLLELLLRMSICAFGTRAGGQLPPSQYPDVEALMQCVVATHHPIPEAGHDIFLSCIKKPFAGRFPGDIKRLQGELWDDDISLDLDSMLEKQLDKEVELEVSGETPNCSTDPVGSGAAGAARGQHQSASMLTSGAGGARGGAAAAAAAGPSNLRRPGSAAQREAPARDGTSSRPSAGTHRASASMLSGEHSGVQGGGGGASVAAGAAARSGAAAARTATSRNALLSLPHVHNRFHNSKQFELQVRSKVPPALQKRQLKHAGASSRPPMASGATSRAQLPGRSMGAGASAAPQRQQQPAREQQQQARVAATPDTRGKAGLPRAQRQQQQASLASGGVCSPEDPRLAAALPPGVAAPPGHDDVVPDTDARPPLPTAPASARALMRAASMRLDFGGAAPVVPGAILPTQQPGLLDGGSTNTSPSGAVAPPPPPADAPTWMVAATRVARSGARGGARSVPAVASLGALAAAGAPPLLAQPSAAHPGAEADAAAEAAAEPMECGSPAGELGGPEQAADAEPVPAAKAQAQAPAEAAHAEEAAPPEEAPAGDAEAVPETEPATSGGRRGRSRARTAAAAPAAAAAEPAPGARRGRSRGTPAAAAPPAEPAAGAEPAAEAAPAARRSRSRGKAAAEAAEDLPEEAAAQQVAALEDAPAARGRRARSAGKAAVEAPAEQPADTPAAQPEAAHAAPGSRRSARHASAAGQAPEQVAEPPAAKKRCAQNAAAPAAAPEQAELLPAAEAPQPRRATRHTPVEPAAAAAEGPPAAAAVEAPQPRRATRHTPVEPAAPTPAPEQAAASKRGRKRRASPPAAEEAAVAAADAAEAAAAALAAGKQQPAQPSAAAPGVDAARVAELASLLGCKRCRESASGCSKCRPVVAQALEEAGLAAVLAGVGKCTKGKCHPANGCSACWKAVKEQLVAPAAGAAAAPSGPAAAAAEDAPEQAPAEGDAAPGQEEQPAGKQPHKRRRLHGGAATAAAVKGAEPAGAVNEPMQPAPQQAAGAPQPVVPMPAAGQAGEATPAGTAGGSGRRPQSRSRRRSSGPSVAQRMAFPDAANKVQQQQQQQQAAAAGAEAAPPRRGRSAGTAQPAKSPAAASRRGRAAIAQLAEAEAAAAEAAAAAASMGQAQAATPMQVEGAAGGPTAAAALREPLAAAQAAAVVARGSDPVRDAMAEAGALSQQLDGGEGDEEMAQQQLQPMGAAEVLAADVVFSPEDLHAVAAAAAGLHAPAEAPRSTLRRRQSGGGSPYAATKLLSSILSPEAGKPKKRPAGSEPAGSRQKRGSAAAGATPPGGASSSPLAALLRQRAAESGLSQPTSPYQDAYEFPGDGPGGGPGDGDNGAAAAEPAAEAPPAAPAGPQVSEAEAASAEVAATEEVPESAEAEQPSPDLSAARSQASAAQRAQAAQAAAARAAAAAGGQEPQLAQQQQQQQEQDGSRDSCPESAVPDSQLQPLSPPEAAGQALGAPAVARAQATPQSRPPQQGRAAQAQGRLSPGARPPRGSVLPAAAPAAGAAAAAALPAERLPAWLRWPRPSETIQYVKLRGGAPAVFEFVVQAVTAQPEQTQQGMRMLVEASIVADSADAMPHTLNLESRHCVRSAAELAAPSQWRWQGEAQPMQQQQQQQQQQQAPGSVRSQAAAAAAPAAPPAETQRHNAASRQQQRRDSLDSYILPGSVQQVRSMRQEQERHGAAPAASPAPQRALFGVPASPAAPAPGSALAQASPARQPLAPHPSPSPARLGSISEFKARRLAAGFPFSPEPGVPAELPPPREPGQAGRAPFRPPRPQAPPPPQFQRQPAEQQPQQRPAAPQQLQALQQGLQQGLQQLNALMPQARQAQRAQRAAGPAAQQHAAAPPPPRQPAAPQPAASDSSDSAAMTAAPAGLRRPSPLSCAVLLERLEEGLEAGGAADGAASLQGCLVLYCTHTTKLAGLPQIVKALVTGVRPMQEGSPRQRISHVAEAVVLASGPSADQLEPLDCPLRQELELAQQQPKPEGVRRHRYWHALGHAPAQLVAEAERMAQPSG